MSCVVTVLTICGSFSFHIFDEYLSLLGFVFRENH